MRSWNAQLCCLVSQLGITLAKLASILRLCSCFCVLLFSKSSCSNVSDCFALVCFGSRKTHAVLKLRPAGQSGLHRNSVSSRHLSGRCWQWLGKYFLFYFRVSFCHVKLLIFMNGDLILKFKSSQHSQKNQCVQPLAVWEMKPPFKLFKTHSALFQFFFQLSFAFVF